MTPGSARVRRWRERQQAGLVVLRVEGGGLEGDHRTEADMMGGSAGCLPECLCPLLQMQGQYRAARGDYGE